MTIEQAGTGAGHPPLEMVGAGGGENRTFVLPGSAFAACLFGALILYFWIGVSPFSDLSGWFAQGSGRETSNVFNQAILLTLSLLVVAALALHPARLLAWSALLPLALVLVWMGCSTLNADFSDSAVRRLIHAGLVGLAASVVLLLPRDTGHFARLVGFCLLAVLGLSYFGILVLPERAIHQLSDAMEPALAGDWRGHFQHKNMTAASMVLVVFFGLYLMKVRLIWLGALLTFLALVMLIMSGGKTSTALLPVVLVVAWLFERLPWLRSSLVLGAVILINVAVLAVVTYPPMRDLVGGLGIDTTFTDRASIWQLSLSAIGERPLIGYGFQSFWESDQLLYGAQSAATWAVSAANAHNAYLDQLITGGWPLLALIGLWLVVLPSHHASEALKRGTDPELTRLYLRIWIFVLYASAFESFIFDASGPVWFTLLIAIAGLRLQARASLANPFASLSRLRPQVEPGTA